MNGDAPLVINGRFLTQRLTGVQRFAEEIAAALGRIYSASGETPLVLLPTSGKEPRSEWSTAAGLELRVVGRFRGQAWEQLELPAFARNSILLNLGNTAPLRGRRQVVVIHDAGVYRCPEAYSRPFRAWYKILHSALARSRAHVVTVSEFSRSEISRCLGIPESRITVIPEGADHMTRLRPDTSILKRHGLCEGSYVLAVGSLSAHKNLGGLRLAARELASRGYHLAIAGGLNEAVFAAQQHALPSPAKYLGRVTDEELRALYESAGCCVFPSFYEGFGLPAIEAMICGCPLLAADIPALRELCADAAHYCNPASPEDIAEKLIALLESRPALAELRRAMSTRVHAYTWEKAAKQLRCLIDQIR
ncbi:MAG: glycosyltransferase family 4 protein [Acetobacteraceae bacterium]|nr:glycosyltransferase family 4 protein [Acetobacteraceae bacterium]